MEYPITLEELTYWLKNTKYNISTGLDGLSTEFFTVFWEKMDPLLHEACILSFENNRIKMEGYFTTSQSHCWRLIIKLLWKYLQEQIKPKLEK